MEVMRESEFNKLVEDGKLAHNPVRDNATQLVTTKIGDEDDVDIFRHYDAVVVYWRGCGHAYTVYVL